MILLLVLLGCHRHDDEERDLPPAYVRPDDVGPYAVGVTDDTVTASDGTALPALIWYPAVADGDASLWTYGDLGEGTGRADLEADCADAHPVVALSHSSGGLMEQSFSLAERLSSHGYLVVAPSHVGNTRDDMDVDTLGASVLRRPQDLADSFDALVARAGDDADPLAGCLDPDAGYAAVGHDLGGTTALQAVGAGLDLASLSALCTEGDALSCHLSLDWLQDHPGETEISLADDRVWAAVALAPTRLLVDAGALEGMVVPVAVFGAAYDTASPWDTVISPLNDALGVTPRGLATLEGAGHLSFTDLCPISPGWPECGEGYLDLDEAHDAVGDTVVPFLDVIGGEDRADHYLPPEDEPVIWTWTR